MSAPLSLSQRIARMATVMCDVHGYEPAQAYALMGERMEMHGREVKRLVTRKVLTLHPLAQAEAQRRLDLLEQDYRECMDALRTYREACYAQRVTSDAPSRTLGMTGGDLCDDHRVVTRAAA